MRITPASRMLALSLILSALVAVASPLDALAAPKPAPLAELAVMARAESDHDVVIVSAVLPDSARLPADIVVPVPTGAEIGWVGEILGADPTKDVETSYTVTPGVGGWDTLALRATRSPRVQVELAVSSVAGDGRSRTLDLALPVISAVGTASVTLQVPAGAVVTSATPGLAQDAGEAGEQYYSAWANSARAGGVIRASVTYETTSQPAAGAAGGGASAAIMVLIAGVLFLVALAVAVASRMHARRAAE